MNISFQWVINPLDALYGAYGGLFLAEGQTLFTSLAVLILVAYAIKHGIVGGMFYFLIHYGLMAIVCEHFLHFYMTPDPLLGGVSVSGFLPALAEYYANFIGLAAMDNMNNAIDAFFKNLQMPGENLLVMPIYWFIHILIWTFQAVAWVSVALSYVMMGVIRLVGPLFIPWMIVPRLSFLFWNWVQTFLQFAFFRVLANALVFVISGVLLNFMVNAVAGNYTLANMAVIAGKLVCITLFSIVLPLGLAIVVSDLFKGTSASGSATQVASTATAVAVVAG